MHDILLGAVRKAAPNPTNWQFATRKENKGATQESIPVIANIKAGFPAAYKQIYGNCTSNAALAADDYYYHGPSTTWVPSTAFTYYCQRAMNGNLKDGDCGSSVEAALVAVRKYGACNSKYYPNDTPLNKKPSKKAYENGLKGHEITKYYNVKTLLQIKKAIAKKYPVVISMDWPFKSMVRGEWILNDPTDAEIKKCNKGHAVVIVGYDDINKCVEIRNSHGPEWGNNGYAYITYKTLQKCIWWDDSYAVIK